MFIRDKNPQSLQAFVAKPERLVFRVATGVAAQLSELLQQVEQHVCTGIDMRNTLMNGGFGPPGVVPSTDAEPHTTFLLSLTPAFYQHIEA